MKYEPTWMKRNPPCFHLLPSFIGKGACSLRQNRCLVNLFLVLWTQTIRHNDTLSRGRFAMMDIWVANGLSWLNYESRMIWRRSGTIWTLFRSRSMNISIWCRPFQCQLDDSHWFIRTFPLVTSYYERNHDLHKRKSCCIKYIFHLVLMCMQTFRLYLPFYIPRLHCLLLLD